MSLPNFPYLVCFSLGLPDTIFFDLSPSTFVIIQSGNAIHSEVDGVTHTVQIWDCAGNERFHTLAPQFFHDIEVCALFRDQFDFSPCWLCISGVNVFQVSIFCLHKDIVDRVSVVSVNEQIEKIMI